MTADQLRAMFAAIDSLPIIPARRCFEIRGEVSSHGARIETNQWAGVIYCCVSVASVA